MSVLTSLTSVAQQPTAGSAAATKNYAEDHRPPLFLMPGSGHGNGGWSDLAWIEVHGKPVKQ
jgi:hypothetical protein